MLSDYPPFLLAYVIISMVTPVLCWVWGGGPERYGAGLALWIHVAFSYGAWKIGDVYVDSTIEDALQAAAFGWLALRSNRWWPFVAAIACAFSLLIHLLTMVTDISWGAAVSARVGLGLLLYAGLMAGVLERWLAGEIPASRGKVWRRRAGPHEGRARGA